MADWSVIRSALGTWAATVTGLTCYWSHRPRPAHFGDAYAILTISGRRTKGNDEILTEWDRTQPAGSDIRRWQAGQRQFVLGVQVRTSRQSDDTDAMHYTSLIRDSVCLPETSEAAFYAADIAFVRILAETDLDYKIDNREMSICQMDLLFNASSIREDQPTTWIEELDAFEFYDAETPATVWWTGDIEVG